MWGVSDRYRVFPGAVLAAVIGAGLLAPKAALASDHAEPPVELYTRIAKGALSCWFGTQGSLKKTHIFHADVAPESVGGAAEITIQQRDPTGETPRAFRAYRISITPTGSGSSLLAENFRMPADTGREMEQDVRRWAGGVFSCSVIGVGGWTAQPTKDAPAETPKAKSKGGGKKVAKKDVPTLVKDADKETTPAKAAGKASGK